MAEDRFGNFDDPRTRYEADRTDPNRLYADDRDFGRSNASIGWIVGAVVLLGILVYAFGWRSDERTADTRSAPTTTGQMTAPAPAARPAPTPGPVGAAPSAPSAPSTTGSSSQ